MRHRQPVTPRPAAAGERGGMLVIGAVGAGVVLVLAAAAVILSAQAWARGMRDEETLPAGTVVAGADVGGMGVEQAAARVEEAVAQRLSEPITVVAGEERWQVTPRELGAQARTDEAVRQALSEATSQDPLTLAWARWFGGSVEAGVPLAVDEQRAAEVARGWADEFNRGIRDADLTWSGSRVELVEHHGGRSLPADDLADDLAAAAREGRERVEVEVSRAPASVTTEQVRPLVEPVRDMVDQALGRDVAVVAEGERWTVSPADVGATPEVGAIVDARVADAGGSAETVEAAADGSSPPVPLTIPDEELRAYVERLAGQVNVAARDARANLVGDRLRVEPHQAGRRVAADEAVQALGSALGGGQDRVQLPVEPVQPDTTAEDYDSTLVLRQNERRLYHFVNGSPVADWPVAVGAGGSPTPTGQFTVGVKRHRPTWNNPDPSGWGSDMPASIGPGPTNPLGVRALNWYDGGRDTLIRFHGTAATNSIGRAASQGCVRLTNDDVRQLYDRVEVGTPILSVRA